MPNWSLASAPPPPATQVLVYGPTPAGGNGHEIGFVIQSARQWWEQVSPTAMELRTETTHTWSVQTITPQKWRYLDTPDI